GRAPGWRGLQRGPTAATLTVARRANADRPAGSTRGEGALSFASIGQFKLGDLLREPPPSDPPDAGPANWAAGALPDAGGGFLGFRLLAELGRGAFSRVFLAQQGDLANRPVALKIGTDLFGEEQALAQLQHTNIVPTYSLHQAGRFQAVCMPYLGSTTLADVFRGLRQGPLPASGRHFVSTLQDRKSTVRSPSSSSDDKVTRWQGDKVTED